MTPERLLLDYLMIFKIQEIEVAQMGDEFFIQTENISNKPRNSDDVTHFISVGGKLMTIYSACVPINMTAYSACITINMSTYSVCVTINGTTYTGCVTINMTTYKL